MQNDRSGPEPAWGGDDKGPPDGYRIIHQGEPLPPYYAAELLRPLVGRTVWAADGGGRVRNGQIKHVPWVKEDQAKDVPAVAFEDEKPLYLRQIVCIAVYDPAM